ncbi:MAG: amino acid ABC transporter permease [Clostridia bacterium]|nr:amino acid ABC transporter permease [Clostridia bacterium]
MDIFSKLGSDIVKLWSDYGSQYMHGAFKTIELAVLATAVGCLIGLICGILQTIPCSKTDNPIKRVIVGIIRVILRIYVEVFRGTPMILQAVFVYFAIPYFLDGANLEVNTAAFLVVSINTGAYMAETVRGGIISIDVGQTEGAKAIGMNHFKTMVHVILPQTMRNIMPQIGNNLIINIKDTSIMFIIGFTELFAVHKAVSGATYLYFPSAAIEMALYLVITVVCSLILRAIERKMDGPENFDVEATGARTDAGGMHIYRKSSKREVR